MDGGAYVTLSPVVLSRGALHAGGAYRCPNVRIRARAVATNTPPNGAFRGFGAPQTHLRDRAPHGPRRRASWGSTRSRCGGATRCVEGDVTPTGQVLRESVGAIEVLDRTAKRAGWAATRRRCERENAAAAKAERRGQAAARRAAAAARPRPGAGLARRGLHRQRRGAAGLAGGARAHARGPAARARRQHRDRPGRDHRVRADRGRAPRRARRAGRGASQPDTGGGAGQRPDRGLAHHDGRGRAARACARGMRERLELFAERAVRDGADFQRGGADASCAQRGPLRVERRYQTPPGIEWDDETYHGDAYPCFSYAAVRGRGRGRPRHLRGARARGHDRAGRRQGDPPGAVRRARSRAARCRRSAGRCSRRCAGRTGASGTTSSPTTSSPPRWTRRRSTSILVENPYPRGPCGAKGVGELPMDVPAPARWWRPSRHATGARLDDHPGHARAAAARAGGGRRRDEPDADRELHRQRPEAAREGAADEAPARRAARGLRPDRHQGRLRRGRVRRLHRAARRRAGELAAWCPRPGRRATRIVTVEGLAEGPRAVAAAAGVRRARRRAVRHLHARHPDHLARAARPHEGPRARRRTRCARRWPATCAAAPATRRSSTRCRRRRSCRRSRSGRSERRSARRGRRRDEGRALRPRRGAPARPGARAAPDARLAARGAAGAAGGRHRPARPAQLRRRRRASASSTCGACASCAACASAQGGLELGALTTFTRAARRTPRVRAALPGAGRRGAPRSAPGRSRTARTLGGNIANASPAGDSLPVLLALDAVVQARSVRGARAVPFADLFRGYRDLALEPDELIVAVSLPAPPARATQFFRKVGTRRAQSISKVVLAGLLRAGARRPRGPRAARAAAAWRRSRCAPAAPSTRCSARGPSPRRSPTRAPRCSRTSRRSTTSAPSATTGCAVAGNVLEQFLRVAEPRFARP